MKIKGSFIEGKLIRRENRFVVTVLINGEYVKAHLRDPGRLGELLVKNAPILLREREHPKKLRYEVIAIKNDNLWILTNSGFHSKLAEELIRSGRISGLRNCKVIGREVKFGKSRLDFLLDCEKKPCLLEVKGCTLVENGYGLFPDAPTERGTRHVKELIKARNEGYRAAILFVVMRMDANVLIPNMKTDIAFTEIMHEAKEKKVEMYAYSFYFDGKNVSPFREIKVVI